MVNAASNVASPEQSNGLRNEPAADPQTVMCELVCQDAEYLAAGFSDVIGTLLLEFPQNLETAFRCLGGVGVGGGGGGSACQKGFDGPG